MKTERELERRGIDYIAAADAEARGDVALQVEIRRTVAWIRYCEAKIAALIGASPMVGEEVLTEDPLAWGKVSAEDIEASEFPGTNTKYAAGVNVWEEKLRWNRAHLATLTKQWIAAGFEARRIEIAERTLDVLASAIDGIVRDLGHNPTDIEVRRVVAKRLAAAQAQGEAS